MPGKIDRVERAARAMVLEEWDGMEWNGVEGRMYGFNIYQLMRVVPLEKSPCPYFLLPNWKQTYWEYVCGERVSDGELTVVHPFNGFRPQKGYLVSLF